MGDIEDIISKVREKPELKGIAKEVVKRAIIESSKGIDISNLGKNDEKIIVKLARELLRNKTGQYRTGKPVETDSMRHYSIRQREKFYPLLNRILDSLKIKSILDLGCGINPVFISKPGMKYYAYEIREDDLEIVMKHFKENSIDGTTKIYDLMSDSYDFPETDICMLMNVLDGIDKKGHRNAHNILSRVKSRIIFVSFPIVKLSGKKMNRPRREWFIKILDSLHLKYYTLNTETESWYFISREEPLLQLISKMQL